MMYYVINKSDSQTVRLTVSNDYGTMKTIMTGLHLTSRQPCWSKRTKAFPSAGNETFCHADSAKIIYCFVSQLCHLVRLLQAKN